MKPMLFSGKSINLPVLLVSAALILANVHATSTNKTSASLDSQGLALVNSTLDEAEKKMLRMGLKRTHVIYQAKASWYGDHFHGKTTANMETFDKYVLSAAHKTLPLNTYLLVTNLHNGKKVVVRVNDRGPYVEGRDLDLSEAAARMVGSYAKGVVPVKFEVLEEA